MHRAKGDSFVRASELSVCDNALWVEISLPNAKPFLICTVYRPPSSNSEWIDQFEEELSIAQATGLEVILMGDFNIDITVHSTKK